MTRAIVDFFKYQWLLLRLLTETIKEAVCRRFTRKCDHPWVATSTLERKHTKVYARCPRCGAER